MSDSKTPLRLNILMKPALKNRTTKSLLIISAIAFIAIAATTAFLFFRMPAASKTETAYDDIEKYPAIEYAPDSTCQENGKLPPTTIDADFDGDGKTDRARIAKADAQQVLVAWLSSRNNAPIILDSIPAESPMAFSIAEKNQNIQTACGKGYWDCSENEPAEINLKNNGIYYYLCESAASIFFWNNDKSAFDRIWISD